MKIVYAMILFTLLRAVEISEYHTHMETFG